MPAAATVAPKSAPPVQRNIAPSSRTAGASAAGPKAASSSAARASALPSFARSSLTPLRAAGAGPTLSPRPKPASPSGSGSGQPMAPHIQEAIENSFEVDLSSVRLHTDAQAQESAQQLSARAFTHGSDIFLGPGERPTDLPLIAHEAAHVVQQQTGHAQQRLSADRGDRYEVEADRASAAVQRGESFTVEERVGPARVQRFGLSDALDWIADKANIIPGFRMFTIVLGVNPINMSRVDATAANVLRALLEIIPGGGLISQALESSGIFEKVGNWVAQQIKTLGMIGSAIKQALLDFIDSLGLSDLFHLGRVWDRAKRIFTEPIDRIINFVTGLVSDIVKFIKDAILQPLAKLAENTKAYPLLKAVLGHDPITGEPVPDDASAILGGLMTLAGQEEMWENIKKANAMARLAAWFKGAKNSLIAFVKQVPGLVISTIKSLELSDIIVLPRAITKVVKVFGGFVVDFISWVGNAVWNLLEIVFDVVSPGAWSYIKKTGAALKSILKNPLPFVRNLVRAAKLGFENFVGNILTHLKAGLIDWLTGSLPGVYIPKALTLGEVGQFAMSVLGITWAQIRGKIVKALGPNGETIMKGLETAFDVVVALVKGGVSAAWDLIKEKITNLKDMVIDGIQSFVIDTIVKKAIPKLVAMFIPGAGFISAIISIYDTIKVFIEKLAKMIAVVKSFVDSIVAIAAGQIEGAAKRVESALAGLLSLAISFLAGFIGLGNISSKIMGVIEKVRAAVDKALDTAIGWLVGKAKSLFAKLFGKDKDKEKDKEKDTKPDTRTDQQKQDDLTRGMAEAQELMQKKEFTAKDVQQHLPGIKAKYKMTALDLVVDSTAGAKETCHVHGEINPKLDTPPTAKDVGDWPVAVGDHIKTVSSNRIEKVLALEKGAITFSQTDSKKAVPAKQPREFFMQAWDAGKIIRTGEMTSEEIYAENARRFGEKVADAIWARGELAKNLHVLDKSEAHHIIPVELWGKEAILREAIESGWDPNAATNGIPLAMGFHGNHPAYTKYVSNRINDWMSAQKGIPLDAVVNPFRAFVNATLIPDLRALIAQASAASKASKESLNDYFSKL
jgi:hypothetical protein